MSFTLSSEQHHTLGIQLNNSVWKLLDKEGRSEKEDKQMLSFALASLYHWHHFDGFNPCNAQRGHWLISRVYAVLENGEKALEHAKICVDYTEENSQGDFDFAYSKEVIARAYAIAGDKEKAISYISEAIEAGKKIEQEVSRKFFYEDLKSEPWNGVEFPES